MMTLVKEIDYLEDVIEDIVESDFLSKNVYIIGNFDEMKVLLKTLIEETELMPHFIELTDPMWDGYDKEFYLTWNTDDEEGIYLERAFRDTAGKYMNFESDVIYMLPEVSDEFKSHFMKGESKADVVFNVEYCEDEDEDDIDIDPDISLVTVGISHDKRGNINGFTKTIVDGGNVITFSFYTDDLDNVAEMAELFGIDLDD